MKLIKTASGKTRVKISRREWEQLGKKAGWNREAAQNTGVNEAIKLWNQGRKAEAAKYMTQLMQSQGGTEVITEQDLEATLSQSAGSSQNIKMSSMKSALMSMFAAGLLAVAPAMGGETNTNNVAPTANTPVATQTQEQTGVDLSGIGKDQAQDLKNWQGNTVDEKGNTVINPINLPKTPQKQKATWQGNTVDEKGNIVINPIDLTKMK